MQNRQATARFSDCKESPSLSTVSLLESLGPQRHVELLVELKAVGHSRARHLAQVLKHGIIITEAMLLLGMLKLSL
jgi:hypothetical protein